MKRAFKTLASVIAFAGIAGCAAIVGIEDDRRFDAGASVSAACTEYCDTVMRACTGTFSVYSSTASCLGACKALPPGDPVEPIGNNIACRKKQADFALSTTEPAAYCPSAGPGGAGTCGSNCESYCTLLQATCPAQYGAMANCPLACAALKDTGKFDAIQDHDGDTLQCRLVHVSNAAGNPAAPPTHCPHSQLVSNEFCVALPDEAPDCAEFCRFNAAACKGDNTVYESNKQCMDVCKALPDGFNREKEENTMGCRRLHIFNSLIDPMATHCSHTSPTGDGHCGIDAPDKTGNCVSYCMLAKSACGTQYAAKYASDSACQLECSTQPDSFGAKHDSLYKVSTAQTGNTVQCRTLHAARALSDPAECANVFGGVCQ
ncbi:MAG: hypothetical protein ABW133_17795 [Polyangiaceae bacterium]